MNYSSLKNLESTNKTTLLSMFSGILSNEKMERLNLLLKKHLNL